jgi:Na+/melibiose symporter-like transporter
VVPLGLIAIYFVLRKLKGEWADAKGEKFDWRGSFLYGISLALIMYGFPKLPEIHGIIYLLSGLIALALFIYWELKIPYPVLELKLFKNNITFRYSNLAALINYSATFAIGFLLSFYLQKIRHMSAQQTGLVLVSSPVIMALLSPSVGKLSDRVEPRLLSSLGMTISAIGLVMLFFLTPNTDIYKLVLILGFLGLGFALFSSPNTSAVMGSVERKHLGVASGSLGTMRLVGQMFSMGIAMMLFALFIGKVEINASNLDYLLHAIKAAFVIFAVLCFLGIFASLARGKVHA